MAVNTAREQYIADVNGLRASLVKHGTDKEEAIRLWSSYVRRGAKPIGVAIVQ